MKHNILSDSLTKQFLKEFKSLSEEYQEPMLWVVRNYDSLSEFMKMISIDEKFLDEKRELAKMDNKPLLHILLSVKKTIMNEPS